MAKAKVDITEAKIKALTPEGQKLLKRAMRYPTEPNLWVIDFFGDIDFK